MIGGRRGKGPDFSASGRRHLVESGLHLVTGGSFGFQAGVQSADIILVFPHPARRRQSGRQASSPWAPMRRSPPVRSVARRLPPPTSSSRPKFSAYARTRGLFAGVALDGSVLAIDYDAIERVYGSGTSPRALFEGRAQRRARLHRRFPRPARRADFTLGPKFD